MTELHWTAGLHHDGSALYVSNPRPAYGETVTIRLRVPKDAPVRAVYLRTAPDGEQHMSAMRPAGADTISAWWAGDLKMHMPRETYRFRVMAADGAYWLTALGVSRADSPDRIDFALLADFDGPLWLSDTVFYQIFPDRFHNGDPANDVQPGAWTRGEHTTQARRWDDPILTYPEGSNLDYYGGDLPGITQKLDYLHDLGVTALYLTPIFTAYSNHRYDIADYDHVDPYLGGDEALATLRRALDARAMRLMLDITPNHCGSHHHWFTAAQADANAPTAEYFIFYHHPDDYASWLGHKSLVKLNYRSQKLRDVMYRGHDSIMRRWLREPYRIDGWRLDVANMTARLGQVQLAHEVKREMRLAVKGENPDAYLLGEHFFDGTPHLQGDELDASMNYGGFNKPVRFWLKDASTPPEQPWFDTVPLPAEAMAEQWRRFLAVVPWVVVCQQFNQLGSHDTTRILTVAGGDVGRAKLGATLLLTFPGVPCLYYGDEIGLEGGRDPDNRRPMPWDESAWNQKLLAHYRRLIRLRREHPALTQGGFQLLAAEGGLIAYMRDSAASRLMIVGWRGPDTLAETSIPVWPAAVADETVFTDLLGGGTYTVEGGLLTLRDLAPGTSLVLSDDSAE